MLESRLKTSPSSVALRFHGNLSQVSLTSDMVFSDGYQSQLAAVTGDVSWQLVANLTMPV